MCKATYFSSAHNGSRMPRTLFQPPQPAVQYVCRLTLTQHQLRTPPHSESSPCKLSNAPVRQEPQNPKRPIPIDSQTTAII